jgi:DNA-binding transcriptional ArsR family regulator
MASAYLRTLEARGLLTVRRTGRRVTYRPSLVSGSGSARTLVTALRLAFKREPLPIEHIFKLATAFTHPRRIAIFRALQNEPKTLVQTQIATGISSRALRRHLRKLENRGFVTRRREIYAVAKRSDAFGKELARLAAE